MNAPMPIPTIWTTGTTDAIKTGTWRSSLAQHVAAPSPCHGACPVRGEIPTWIGQARDRDFRAAWDTLALHNPFPSIAGRICHHPCETACNRTGHDEALSICKLERFVGDMALAEGWQFTPPAVERSQTVAVVGAGPSGLSAAYQLRRRGYAVTLIESQAELGGLMRYGIPAYRLSRDILDGEIARIAAFGVQVRCGQPLVDAQHLARLRTEFDAVYLATGARRQKRLPQLDYDQPWVFDGADYLARHSMDQAPALGHRVVVIGGGSAALDVARSLRRSGHTVTILALESEARLPAQREEVIEALEEGIGLVDGSMLQAVHRSGEALQLDCVRVNFQPGAQRGQFSVTAVEDSAFVLEADAVVSSIGQDPDLSLFGDALATDGALLKADRSGATSADGVWAGGDLTSMARFVTEAVGMGERAAIDIHHRLQAGADAADAAASAGEPMVALQNISLHYHPKRARPAAETLAAAERVASHAEVQLGLDIEQALAETVRCFSCGLCTHCDNCVTYCPDMAVQRDGSGYIVLTDYCKGCGVCVTECPTGSMKMLEEAR